MRTISRDTLFRIAFGMVLCAGLWSAAGAVLADTRQVSAGDAVGAVDRARGSVSAITRNVPRPLDDGSEILYRDTILTGRETRAEITFIDETELMLGDDTRLTIDELVFDPAGDSSAVLTLSRGVFRMVSGLVNKTPGGSMTLRTPVATIGVRGTDFWGRQDAEKLTLVLIDDGALDVSNGAQAVSLTEPLTGVVIERGADEIQRISITPEELAEAASTVTW